MGFTSARAQAAARAITLVCLLGTVTEAAQAYPATWEFKGTITSVAGDFPDDFTPGMPFRVVVTFDTSEPISNVQTNWTDPVTGQVGRRYRYFGPPTLRFAIFAGESCNPCVPQDEAGFDPGQNSILVRDNYAGDTGIGTPTISTDGYSFGTVLPDGLNIGIILRDAYNRFDPPLVEVDPNNPRPLPVEPDPRLGGLALGVFQAFVPGGTDSLQVDLDAVSVPTYGTYYFLSARHCQYADLNLNHPSTGDDCIAAGQGGAERAQTTGGVAGQGDFSRTVTHTKASPIPGAPDDVLGTVFGAASFGGQGSLPVLRGSSFPTAVGRTNSNLLAYQEYTFGGTQAIPLLLVADLGYSIHSNWEPGSETYPPAIVTRRADFGLGPDIGEGLRPGGAEFATVLSVVDANAVSASAMAAATRQFNSLQCGEESLNTLPDGTAWPAGSILGAAVFLSPPSQQTPPDETESVRLEILACDNGQISTEPITVGPGGRFYLVASMQSPARGSWAQDGQPAPARNGEVDAANTVRVIPDPEAPPAVQQQLALGIAPACTDCGFEPELVIDIKPESTDNVINPGSSGAIPVTLFGSDRFDVRGVNQATLRLGTLSLRTKGRGAAGCGVSDSNADGLPDLVCHFQNDPEDWQPGQTIATLSGKLLNGESIFASDSIRLVPGS